MAKLKADAKLAADVYVKFLGAHNASNWKGVLEWEGHLEQLLEYQDDDSCCAILDIFKNAHSMEMTALTTSAQHPFEHALAAVRLGERRLEYLGKLERFRDQGARPSLRETPFREWLLSRPAQLCARVQSDHLPPGEEQGRMLV